MKMKGVLFTAGLMSLTLGQCSDTASMAGAGGVEGGVKPAAESAYAHYALSQQGQKVAVMDGAKTVATCSAELPNIEKFKLVNKKSQVVVKSRGNHGPAAVELFDASTGIRRAKVMAYEISNGQPNWAIGMRD